MRDYNKLSYDELIQINDELRYTIANLKKQQEEYEKCVARVNPPTQTYKELETKLEQFENIKKTEIDDLLSKIEILNQTIKKSTEDIFNLKNRNIDLERVIEKQNVVISMTAGYISSTPQFSNDYPINVKKWLIGGME
jgi:chromosome segregation ATPase